MADWINDDTPDPDYGEAPNLRLLQTEYERMVGRKARTKPRRSIVNGEIRKALKTEEKRLAKALKRVQKLIAGATDGVKKAKRRRRATNATSDEGKAGATAVRAKAAPKRKAAEPTKAGRESATEATIKPAGTPVQPAPSRIGARRPGSEQSAKPKRNIDDLLSDDK